jgi:hypothetical protein
MNEGWNWMSLNVFTEDMSLNSMLSSLDDNAEYVKSQSGYADYYAGFGWFGTLADMDNVSMYKLRMGIEDSIVLTGTPVDVQSTIFNMSEGWNWIAYAPQYTFDINMALTNVPDGNAEYIKSQAGYADYYSGFGWFGTLAEMDPFLGYLIRVTTDTQFTYYAGDGFARSTVEEFSPVNYDVFDLNMHDYENNGSMTVALYDDNNRIQSDDYLLAAFDEMGQCVGHTPAMIFPFDGVCPTHCPISSNAARR